MFRQETTRYLDTLMLLREQEVKKAVQTALETEYAPFEKQIIEARDKLIAEETEQKNIIIARIEAEYAKTVEGIRADAVKECELKKASVIEDATKTATASIDTFISVVSREADKAKF